MEKFSEKDIDYIFQEGSKKHEFPFKESAWDNMEVLLDKQDRRRKYGYTSLILLGLIASSFIAYTVYSSNNKKPSKIEQKKQAAATPSNTIATTENKIIDSNIGISEIKSKTSSSIENNKKNTSFKTTSNRVGIALNSKTQNTPNTTSTLRNNSNKNSTLNFSIRENNSSLSTNVELKSNFTKTENSTSDIKLIDKLPAVTSLTTLGIKNVQGQFAKDFPSSEILLSKQPGRFALGIVLAREWSTVGMNTDMTDGYRIGGEISYRLNNRLQLSSGFIFSKKSYKMEGNQFTPELKWASDAVPEIVKGKSTVFEIPLELNYFFSGSNKNSFYVAGGLTTYIMDREWYDFEFEDPNFINDPNIPKFQNNIGSNKSIHYFGIGRFSVGYQKQINKNVAMQFAPYINIPLTGIGMGDVDLVSAGIQVKASFRK